MQHVSLLKQLFRNINCFNFSVMSSYVICSFILGLFYSPQFIEVFNEIKQLASHPMLNVSWALGPTMVSGVTVCTVLALPLWVCWASAKVLPLSLPEAIKDNSCVCGSEGCEGK